MFFKCFFGLLLMAIFSNQILAQTMPPIEAGVSHELAKWRAANYSNARYKLDITLEKGAPLMKGEIEIRVDLSDEGVKNPLILDWRTTQFENDKDKPFANVVEVNDAMNIRSQINKEHLLVPNGLLKTGENVIRIEFASPIKTSGAAITRYVDKEDNAEYIYSLFVPSDASTAFPVFDQPDLKARFTLTVDMPNGWNVVSNAHAEPVRINSNLNALLPENKSGQPYRTYTHSFEETKPISPYVFAFAAGNFERFVEEYTDSVDSMLAKATDDWTKIAKPLFDPTKTKIYVRKSQAEKFKQHAAEVFRLNREGVKFLESWFDYKFPFPEYDLVLIPEFPFGGMEHAGATFLREDRIIFPTEPTANDYITRANVIFHEAAHQWFGDTVTMKWFDDLWLKEGFAEFMAYKTMEKVLPQYNAWKAFYERNKPLAYLTDSTRGTTPIYQEIPNLSAAKSAYGNIVYRKAPAFLRQAEFYLGEDKFQTAVRQFLKKHEFANAEWTDLVKEFQVVSGYDLVYWGNDWVKKRGVPIIRINNNVITQENSINEKAGWVQKFQIYTFEKNPNPKYKDTVLIEPVLLDKFSQPIKLSTNATFIFPNYQDYGYGIFLLDYESRNYVLANINSEKDDFLRAMMWGTLWDSVRETELNPKDYVELAIKNISGEKDELTVQTILSRVSTAMNYYLSVPPAAAGGLTRKTNISNSGLQLSATANGSDIAARLEKILLERMKNAETLGLRITFYRAFLNVASTEESKQNLKEILSGKLEIKGLKLKTKDKFDIVTRLLVLDDADAPKLLEDLSKTETSDEAKRYLYAARAGIATAENKAKFWNDFVNDKELSESYIEAAFVPFNAIRHADLTLPYLEKALTELPNLKRNRKIFFVNGWLSAFIGGQRDEKALAIIDKFLTDNPNLDRDLRLKILEVADNLERSIKIRQRYPS